MGLSPSDEGGASRGYLGGFGMVLSSNMINFNYYVTGFMVIHQLVVISFNKILPRLVVILINAVESANLRAS